MLNKLIFLLVTTFFLTQIAFSQEIDSYRKEDKTPPVISSVSFSVTSSDSVTISWTTDEPSDSIVKHGISPNLNTRILNSEMVTSHTLMVGGLVGGTTYDFCVESRDDSNNQARDCGHSFTTDSVVKDDTTSPIISDVNASEVSASSAIINWTTNEIATGQVEYGISESYGSESSLDETLNVEHSMTLSGLVPSTVYQVHVHSTDGSGNKSSSPNFSFTTSATTSTPPSESKPLGPVISNVVFHTVDETKVKASWSTNIPANSQVEYGLDSSYENKTEIDETLKESHEQQITHLSPNTEYYGHVLSRSSDGILSFSDDFTFVTAGGTSDTGSEINPPENSLGNDIKKSNSSGSSNKKRTQPATTETIKNVSSRTGKVNAVSAYGLDHTILLSWKKPSGSDFAGVKIVKNTEKYPTNTTDGQLIHDGNGLIFSDINLTNNRTYYYSIFAYDKSGINSEPVQLSVAPISGKNYSTTKSNLGKISILTTKDFGIGTRGVVVEYLQKLLATSPDLYPEGLVTGYFGPLTHAALIRFQKEYDIPQTGIVDANVRSAAEELTIQQQVIENFPKESTLSLGARGEKIMVLQIALVQFNYLTEDSMTGYFGQKTKEAVTKFQKDNQITLETGFVGDITRTKMFEMLHSSTTNSQNF